MPVVRMPVVLNGAAAVHSHTLLLGLTGLLITAGPGSTADGAEMGLAPPFPARPFMWVFASRVIGA